MRGKKMVTLKIVNQVW